MIPTVSPAPRSSRAPPNRAAACGKVNEIRQWQAGSLAVAASSLTSSNASITNGSFGGQYNAGANVDKFVTIDVTDPEAPVKLGGDNTYAPARKRLAQLEVTATTHLAA